MGVLCSPVSIALRTVLIFNLGAWFAHFGHDILTLFLSLFLFGYNLGLYSFSPYISFSYGTLELGLVCLFSCVFILVCLFSFALFVLV